MTCLSKRKSPPFTEALQLPSLREGVGASERGRQSEMKFCCFFSPLFYTKAKTERAWHNSWDCNNWHQAVVHSVTCWHCPLSIPSKCSKSMSAPWAPHPYYDIRLQHPTMPDAQIWACTHFHNMKTNVNVYTDCHCFSVYKYSYILTRTFVQHLITTLIHVRSVNWLRCWRPRSDVADFNWQLKSNFKP